MDNNNNNNNNGLTEYNNKMSHYLSRLPLNHRFIEITKCCGYSEIHPILRTASLTELYDTVTRIFECHRICELYIRVKNPELNTLNCQCDDNYILIHIDRNPNVNSFVQLMQEHKIPPIYFLPASVVYRIYLDDGHRHDTHKCMFDDV